jgi:UDP-N-acetyl-alpha-D-muramoyl-L-alanyl-L-glutamate epimerase
MTFKELRQKHPRLIYQGFEKSFNEGNLVVRFNFLLDPDIDFHPEITLPNVDPERVSDNLIFNLGMVELISYWKAACSPEIVIKTGHLDEGQISFWKDLLINGLGEFFYQNKIDFTKDIVEIKAEGDMFPAYTGELKDRYLVLVGGGKDSAVTLELFSKRGKEYRVQTLNSKSY